MRLKMSKIICYCKNVSEKEILEAKEKGADSLKKIQEMTGACTGNKCKELNPKGICCSAEILKLLNGKNNSSNGTCSCCNK